MMKRLHAIRVDTLRRPAHGQQALPMKSVTGRTEIGSGDKQETTKWEH